MTEPTSGNNGRRTRRRGAVVPYDFTAPVRLAREHMRLFEMALETFARQWATQLTSRLQAPSGVNFVGIDQRTYDSYVTSLESPSVLVLFASEVLGHGVLAMPSDAALNHIDHALGGQGGDQPSRHLTDIEVSITLTMCERALAGITYAFASICSVDVEVEAMKQDPQLLQTGRANDIVVLAEFEMFLGDQRHPVQLMLPLGPLQERLAAAASPDTSRSVEEERRARHAADTLNAALPSVPVDVCLRLTPVTMPPEEVLRLQVGDIVRMPHPRSLALEVAASNTVVAQGVPTKSGKHRACLIVNTEDISS